MRPTLAFILTGAVLLSACDSPAPAPPPSSSSPAQTAHATNSTQTVAVPPVSSAHGGGAPAAPASPAVNADAKPSLPTPELDAKIEKAEAKVKTAGASTADKKAAAAAYVERANVYYSAGTPSLYKFALGDFRRALRYDPSNEEARGKMEQIVSIYQSMGRPVPSNGLDQ